MSVEEGIAQHGTNLKRTVGGGHAQIFHQDLNGCGFSKIHSTHRPRSHQIDIVKHVRVGRHFRVAYDHPHPTCVEVRCCMAFSEVVAGSVRWEEGAREAHSRQIGFVGVTFDTGNAVLKEVSHQRLAVGCAPFERARSGRHGGICDGPVDPLHVRAERPQNHTVDEK